MPPKKTIKTYEADIRTLHRKIKKLEAGALKYPNNQKLKLKLDAKQETQKRKVKRWAENCNPVVQVANNEGIPWKSEDMPWGDTGRFLETRPMLLKKDNKVNGIHVKQVGDYVCFIQGANTWYPKVVDRKSWEDMNNTFVDEENRSRFFREIATFNQDPRFKDIPDKKLDIYAECSKYDFLAKIPPYPVQCKFCLKVKRIRSDDNLVYYCTERGTGHTVKPDSSCRSFDPYKRSDGELKALIKKKRTILGQLKKAGVEVCWQGSRFEAAHQYPIDILEWVKGNYIAILGLDDQPYHDKAFLKNRLAALEADMKQTKAALGVTV